MPPDPSTSKKGHPVNRSLHRVPRKQTLSHLLAGALLSTGLGAHAQSTTPADVAAPAAATVTVTSNINLLSQYRFRGIEQTWGKPAVQGGADATWASGWYAGLWASNVSGNSYPGGSLELDYYGGYNGKLTEALGYTLGGYGYAYPGANVARAACPSAAFSAPCALPSQRFDTFELNGGLSWRWVSYKLSVSATDYFGANTRTGYQSGTHGSRYHDLTITWPLSDQLSLVAHLGRTEVRSRYGSEALSASYTDHRLALSQTWADGWNASLAWVGATNDRFFRPPVGGLSSANGSTRTLNRQAVVAQVGRNF